SRIVSNYEFNFNFKFRIPPPPPPSPSPWPAVRRSRCPLSGARGSRRMADGRRGEKHGPRGLDRSAGGSEMKEAQTARAATVPCPFCGTLNRVDMGRVADRPKCGECGRPLLLDRPIKVTDESLDRVVADAGVPVLVDFYADWCGPCKLM